MTVQEQDSPMPQHSQDSPHGCSIGFGLMIETDEVVLPGILLQMPCQNQVELSRINQTYNLVFAAVQDCAFCVYICMCDF